MRMRWIPLLLLAMILLAACGESAAPKAQGADLSGVKNYLLEKATTLTTYTGALKKSSNDYYTLAKNANFDYAKLAQNQQQDVLKYLTAARNGWRTASPAYEQMEGIVAGVPSLSDYDLIMDAGTSAKEGGDSVAPYDLALPDGRVLTKPGNIFGVLEAAMWGTESEFVVKGPVVDYDGNGTQDFGDVMPDANVLKSASEALDKYAIELLGAAKKWQPNLSETFSALVGNVPTIGEFFESWKASRFVSGEKSEQHDFVAISRLSDIVDNITSWQTIYQGISTQGKQADADLDNQIIKGMSDLKTYVQDLKQQEAGGKRFTPEQAELLGEEAQTRATALTGLITQMAAKLNVKIEQK